MILPATEEVSLRSELLDTWDVSTILPRFGRARWRRWQLLGRASRCWRAQWMRQPSALQPEGGLRTPALVRRGRIAVQDAVELVPTFDWPEDRLILMMAGGEAALLRSVENAEDRVDLAAAIVEQHAIGATDVWVESLPAAPHDLRLPRSRQRAATAH